MLLPLFCPTRFIQYAESLRHWQFVQLYSMNQSTLSCSAELAAPSMLAPPDQDVNLLGQLVNDVGEPLRRHRITGNIVDTDNVIGFLQNRLFEDLFRKGRAKKRTMWCKKRISGCKMKSSSTLMMNIRVLCASLDVYLR